MKALLYITLLFALLVNDRAVLAQEASSPDTSIGKTIRRPHILYAEVMGRAGYWNIGYGYSFFQRGKHELNATVGFNYMYYWDIRQISMFPVGLFYRFGERFKLEGGFTINPVINWPRFRGAVKYYPETEESIRVLDHYVVLIPSLGFVYGTKNGKFEVGIRYTPLFDVIDFRGTIPYSFGAFFHYRIQHPKK